MKKHITSFIMLGLMFTACNNTPKTTPITSINPYANGAQYPWTDSSIQLTAIPLITSGFLSDQTWTAASNGWGAVEKNKSNGEQNANDGTGISIGGKKYAKGFGIHANSTIKYDLASNCSSFTAEIGIDDEVRFQTQRGTVIFQVWADGTKLYDSGIVNSTTATKAVSVNVTGKSTLQLTVTDAGDGNWYDHASWGDAKIICNNTSSNVVYLSDLAFDYGNTTGRPIAPNNAWGPIERDMSNGEQLAKDGQVISIRGQKFTKGVGLHANSLLRIDLANVYQKLNCLTGFLAFKSTIGIDDETKGNGKASFQFNFGGTGPFNRAGKTYQLTGLTPAITIDYGISGNDEMQFIVHSVDSNNSSAHVSLGNARFECVSTPILQISSDKTVLDAPGKAVITASVTSPYVRKVDFFDALSFEGRKNIPFATADSAPYATDFIAYGTKNYGVSVYAIAYTDDGFIARSERISITYKAPIVSAWQGTIKLPGGIGITSDTEGNTYAVGKLRSNFDGTYPNYYPIADWIVYLVKFDPSGKIQWVNNITTYPFGRRGRATADISNVKLRFSTAGNAILLTYNKICPDCAGLGSFLQHGAVHTFNATTGEALLTRTGRGDSETRAVGLLTSFGKPTLFEMEYFSPRYVTPDNLLPATYILSTEFPGSVSHSTYYKTYAAPNTPPIVTDRDFQGEIGQIVINDATGRTLISKCIRIALTSTACRHIIQTVLYPGDPGFTTDKIISEDTATDTRAMPQPFLDASGGAYYIQQSANKSTLSELNSLWTKESTGPEVFTSVRDYPVKEASLTGLVVGVLTNTNTLHPYTRLELRDASTGNIVRNLAIKPSSTNELSWTLDGQGSMFEITPEIGEDGLPTTSVLLNKYNANGIKQ